MSDYVEESTGKKRAARSGKARAKGTTSPAAPTRPSAGDGDSLNDPVNRGIVDILQEDGRVPFATIAKKLGVSEGTVRNRVNRMTESGALRIIGIADPLAVGYTGYAMLGLSLSSGADPEAVAKRFADLEAVTYVVLVAGRFDMLVEIILPDNGAVRDFIVRHCYRAKDIASVEPMMALATYKNLLKWGQP